MYFRRKSSEFMFDAFEEVVEVAAHQQGYKGVEDLQQAWRIRSTSQGDEGAMCVRLDIESHGRCAHGVRAENNAPRRDVLDNLLLDYAEPLVAPPEAAAGANWT